MNSLWLTGLREEIMKKIECEGVGDNDGFFEMEVKARPVEPVVMLPCPTSPGHWKKVFEGQESFWDVYFRQHNVAFATNENQTDPCEALSGEWVKISNEYRGRLKT